MNDFDGLWYDCEGHKTSTSREQCSCEEKCAGFFKDFCFYAEDIKAELVDTGLLNNADEICLVRDAHISYLLSAIDELSAGFVTLDASRPWIFYWILHALNLLQCEPVNLFSRVISTLQSMYSREGGGGYGGGPVQLAHCAPTYAAVLALCTVGTSEALSSIDRFGLHDFFMSMKDVSGGFRMHRDGEVDCRGTYTVLAVARICNILTSELTNGVAEYLLSCQQYEGGFGGEPNNEAHGGYNFCAIAALLILNKTDLCDLDGLEYWLINRQMKLEGGFQGRTNKLVDACYSFWQGSALAILEMIRNGGSDLYDMEMYLSGNNSHINEDVLIGNEEVVEEEASFVTNDNGHLLFNQLSLQRYILNCCQNHRKGGLIDKPGKGRDFYHTCYALSGLSIAQNSQLYRYRYTSTSSDNDNCHNAGRGIQYKPLVFGDLRRNLLIPTSAVFNISLEKLDFAIRFFYSLPALP